MDEDNCIYYAQIRGFLTDQYCEKSAVITWLLPTQESPPPEDCFDPPTYIIGKPFDDTKRKRNRINFNFAGPEEEIFRNLSCMEFVMHAPSDYYKAKTTPYPQVYPAYEPGFIWTTLKPIQKLRAMDP